MNRFLLLPLLFCLSLLTACGGGPSPRSRRSFDEIRSLVEAKTAAEVEALLGEPDTRQRILIGDERWIWWNYTFLDGDNYPPEVRGRIVHLEITFLNPETDAASPHPYSEWKVSGPLGISYSVPSS